MASSSRMHARTHYEWDVRTGRHSHRLASHAGRAMASYNYLLAAVPTERSYSYRAKEKRPASAASDPMELQVASRPQRREYQWDGRRAGGRVLRAR